MQGRYTLGALKASVSNVTLPINLRIATLDLDLGGSEFDSESGKLKLEQPGNVVATVSADAVADLLERQSGGVLRDVRVELEGGLVRVEATAKVVFEVRAVVTCRLVIEDGKRLIVELEDVSVPMARGLVEGQLAKTNPLLDTSDLPLDLRLTEAVVAEGVVTLRAQAN